MRTLFLFIILFSVNVDAQTTLSWSGYTAGSVGSTYTTGTYPNQMSAVVTANNTTQGDGTPKYSTSTSPNCYIAAGGLALYANPFRNYASSYYQLSIRLNQGYSGACATASFTIKDINSKESVGTFLDVVEISATDGNNTSVPAANIAVTPPSSTNVVIVGNTKKIIGHNNNNESYVYTGTSPYSNLSSGACNSTSVTITPPAGVPLKTITIKFRPGNGGTASFSCSTCAYVVNSSGGVWYPEPQYISISNITLSPTAGCTPLPVELTSFEGTCKENARSFFWSTASELNNDYFTLEMSKDAEQFEALDKIKGAGTSNTIINYEYNSNSIPEGYQYFRLRQTDYDGQNKVSEIIRMDCDKNSFKTITVNAYPNPAEDLLNINFNEPVDEFLQYEITDILGNRVLIRSFQTNYENTIDISSFSNGVYILSVISQNQHQQFTKVEFIKN